MSKNRKRTVKELYNATVETKITPVLSGGYPMQGPVDEMDRADRTRIQRYNMASSRVDKGVGKSNVSKKIDLKVDSGTCNSCSAPCSSCFQFNQPTMGSKGGESSSETCRRNSSNCSVNVPPTLKSRKCEIGQNIASEASNIRCADSNSDSFSENAKSKSTRWNFDVTVAPHDVEMSSKWSYGVSVGENRDDIKPNKRESDKYCLENKFKDFIDFEGRTDNTSCATGANGVTKMSDADSGTIESKRFTTYAASPDCLGSQDHVEAVPSQTASCPQTIDVEGSKKRSRQNCNETNIQEVYPPTYFPDDLFDLGLADNTLSKNIDVDVGSRIRQSKSSNSLKGKSIEFDSRFQHGKAIPKCHSEYLKPLVTEKIISNTICREEYALCISGDTQDNKLGVAGADPKPSVEHFLKLESDNSNITACLTTGTSNSAELMQEVAKVRELLVVPDYKEISVQSQNVHGHPTEALNSAEKIHVNGTDESDAVEHDQVCDTCGDIGQEDLLAVCSRCSDGAEHTYCMAKKLAKVPECGWMCEDCKIEERESQMNNKSGALGGRKQRFSGRMNSEKAHVSGKSGGNDTYLETNKTGKDVSFLDASFLKVSSKRSADDVQNSLVAKKRALDSTGISPKASIPNRVGLLCHRSLKDIDRGKMKPVNQFRSVVDPVTNNPGTPSPTLGTRQQTHRGTFLKSNSFSTANAKPKLKLVDEVVLRKQKSMREPSSDTKEGHNGVMGKPMSFTAISSSRFCSGESDVKMLSPRFSNVQDIVGLKHAKQQDFANRKTSSKLEYSLASPMIASSTICSQPSTTVKCIVDHKLVSDGETVSFSTRDTRESKAKLADSKLTQSTTTVNHVVCNDSEQPVLCGEVKKHLFSASRVSNYAKQNRIEARMKENFSSASLAADQPVSKVAESLSDRLQRLAPDVITTSNLEEPDKSNKVKAALEAALSKMPEIYRKNRASDHFDEVSSLSIKREVSSHDQLSYSYSTKPMKLDCEKAMNKGPATAWNSNADSTKQVIDTSVKQFSLSAVAIDSRMVNVLANPTDGIPSMMDMPSQASAGTSSLLTKTAIPENEYIWQGCFEVHRNGKVPLLYDGFQAHLSTCASPRVIQAMNNFPVKVLLNEVPRLSTWPIQFEEIGVREEHIALYFFARDHESYVKSYKNVVETMIRNDLAFRGNIAGVDILIFPSNQLPLKSQRWNMMFFLWGVFRGKRVDHMQEVSGSQMKLSRPLDMPTAIMSLPENRCSYIPLDKEVDLCHMVSDASLEAHTLTDMPQLSSAGTSGETKSMPSFQKGMCSNLTVEQPHYKMDSKLLTTTRKWPLQSWPEVRCTPTSVEERADSDCKVNSISHVSIEGRSASSSCSSDKKMINRLDTPFDDQPSPQYLCEVTPGVQNLALLHSLGKTEGTAERYFFPADLFPVKNIGLGDDRSVPWKGKEVLHERVPNLELALGAETKLTKQSRQDQALCFAATNAEEEDISPALSLSLSFPFPDKDHMRRSLV